MSNIAGAMQIGQGVGAVVSGITQSNAANMQGEYAQQQFDTEAQLAQLQGEAAGIEGQTALEAQGLQAAREMGQARASFAGQGITSNSGSAVAEEGAITAIDAKNASTLKNQIWQKQFGYSFQSMEDINQGAMARITGQTNANAELTSGILSGINYGAKAGESFYQASKPTIPSGGPSTAISNTTADEAMNEYWAQQSGAPGAGS
jgi:hypothetical protein